MKRITITQTVIAFFAITCMSACNNSDGKKMSASAPASPTDTKPKASDGLTEAALIGKWKSSEYFDEASVAEVIGESNNDKVTITFSGEATYYEGGTGKSEGQITASFPATEEHGPINLKFNFSGTTTWKLSGNELLETTVDAKTEPANDEARELLQKDPSMAESLRPLKGETEKYKIVNYTPTLIELEGEDKIRITLHKL